VAQILAHCKR